MTFSKSFLICMFKNPNFAEIFTNLAEIFTNLAENLEKKVEFRRVHGVRFFQLLYGPSTATVRHLHGYLMAPPQLPVRHLQGYRGLVFFVNARNTTTTKKFR